MPEPQGLAIAEHDFALAKSELRGNHTEHLKQLSEGEALNQLRTYNRMLLRLLASDERWHRADELRTERLLERFPDSQYVAFTRKPISMSEKRTDAVRAVEQEEEVFILPRSQTAALHLLSRLPYQRIAQLGIPATFQRDGHSFRFYFNLQSVSQIARGI